MHALPLLWARAGCFARAFVLTIVVADLTRAVAGAEFHVAVDGSDTNPGTRRGPFRTIQHAADLAQPGDVITVHEGVYRERINPPRGGTSDRRRIVYRAAPGENVAIKGSEQIRSWEKVQDDVWKVVLPNSFFADFNPYQDRIHGDWFNGKGREHHTGAVYLNGEWLTEAAKLEEVFSPDSPAWVRQGDRQVLLNVAWLRPVLGAESTAIPATRLAARNGTTNAACSEGGECLGWIMPGDWVRYDQVDFKEGVSELEIRAASASAGGIIELRLDAPDGELLGQCPVANTGGWQSWVSHPTHITPVRGLKTLFLVFRSRTPSAINPRLWFAQVDRTNTTLWAQFRNIDPNQALVEINVRRTVFYPDAPGRNYLTVRGFTLRDAATPWAPPTAEQVGLIGTHWSQGWIIESNLVSHSICSGIALGKHGDQFDNTSADTAEGYVKTIERAHAHAIPWRPENIGHHIVRYNTVSDCEQAGIVGSLGAAFSTVVGNTIHDIHVRRLFTGAEMAGIKFHAAIDTTIRGNHIYRTCLGLWLDWMAQGTRVSGNLFHDNAGQDLFVEVDHGPFVVDNNLFLSPTALLDMSEGGAYVHNLFAGKITNRPEPDRQTPYHPAHDTTVAGLRSVRGGDDRFFNNLFVGDGGRSPILRPQPGKELQWISGFGLWGYDCRAQPLRTGGNVYYHGAQPYTNETSSLVLTELDPVIRLFEEGGHQYLRFAPGTSLAQPETTRITTKLLGHASVADLPYVNPDDSPLKLDTDYFGRHRRRHPTPGPFDQLAGNEEELRVW